VGYYYYGLFYSAVYGFDTTKCIVEPSSTFNELIISASFKILPLKIIFISSGLDLVYFPNSSFNFNTFQSVSTLTSKF